MGSYKVQVSRCLTNIGVIGQLIKVTHGLCCWGLVVTGIRPATAVEVVRFRGANGVVLWVSLVLKSQDFAAGFCPGRVADQIRRGGSGLSSRRWSLSLERETRSAE